MLRDKPAVTKTAAGEQKLSGVFLQDYGGCLKEFGKFIYHQTGIRILPCKEGSAEKWS